MTRSIRDLQDLRKLMMNWNVRQQVGMQGKKKATISIYWSLHYMPSTIPTYYLKRKSLNAQKSLLETNTQIVLSKTRQYQSHTQQSWLTMKSNHPCPKLFILSTIMLYLQASQDLNLTCFWLGMSEWRGKPQHYQVRLFFKPYSPTVPPPHAKFLVPQLCTWAWRKL